MLRNLLVILIVSAGFPALAADMAIKAPRVAPLVEYSGWQGAYVGVQGGQTLGAFSPFCRTCGLTGTEINLDDNAWLVGGQIGYLIQPSNGFIVLGLELGVQYLGFKSEAQLVPAVGVLPAVLLQQKVDWLAYANVRAGIALGQNGLLYLTGGPAWAHARGAVLNLAALPVDTSNESSLLGFDIGGGLEWKLWQNASLGVEYRHYDFGKASAANPIFTTGLGIGSDKLTFEQIVGRLNFKLN